MDASRNRTALERIFATQREGTREQVSRSYEERMDLLGRLGRIFEQHRDELVDAVAADFGIRSRYETILLDLMLGISEIKFARRNLKTWLRARRVKTDIFGLPGSSRLVPQPLGVVGVLGTWNYPLGTIFVGAAGALAAGNRVIAKPSEVSANAAEASERLVRRYFAEEEFAIVQGGPDMAQAMTALPFDHILFTGSPAVGRKVYEAAAANLTPVTLELGGKCPAIVGKGASLAQVCESLVFGKLLNAGQTCIAADYAFVHVDQMESFVAALRAQVAKCYPNAASNPDFTSIINDRQFARLQGLLDDAEAKGATVLNLSDNGDGTLPERHRIVPLAVLDVTDDMAMMQEEIFGPILPIMPYRSEDELIRYVNRHERPLALYYFGDESEERRKIISETHAGGVTLNGTVMHVFQRRLPFGGIGQSGIGAYTGVASFERFTHYKPVFSQPKLSLLGQLLPPYSSKTEGLLNIFEKIL